MKKTKPLIASLYLFAMCSAWAAGIDDITNYQSGASVKPAGQAYTVEDIINKLPDTLDDNGVYRGIVNSNNHQRSSDWTDSSDAAAQAFDEQNFGECQVYYIHDAHVPGTYGAQAFQATLRFLFPADEKAKADASKALKSNLAELEREKRTRIIAKQKKCPDREAYSARLKELLDAVVNAAPRIQEENRHRVELAKEEAKKKREQETAQAKAKQQAQQQALAEKHAADLAEQKGREELSAKMAACRATPENKLFEVSNVIVYNRGLAEEARRAIAHEKEAAKISGVENKALLHEAGNRIVGATKLNEEHFKTYKQLGGTADGVDSVQARPDPCKQFE